MENYTERHDETQITMDILFNQGDVTEIYVFELEKATAGSVLDLSSYTVEITRISVYYELNAPQKTGI